MTLVILAAGMGSRYGGLKQIDPMTEHGEFIIDYSVYDAKEAGFTKVVFIIKEAFQLIAGGITLRKGKMLKGALLAGKICTTVLFISLIVLVMIPSLSQEAVTIIAQIDAVFMLISFLQYICAYWKKSEKIQDIQDQI